MKVERVCKSCSKKFMAREADVKRGWARCCSKSCAASVSNAKTGKFAKFMRGQELADSYGQPEEFSNAHLFSNEEHDCNKS